MLIRISSQTQPFVSGGRYAAHAHLAALPPPPPSFLRLPTRTPHVNINACRLTHTYTHAHTQTSSPPELPAVFFFQTEHVVCVAPRNLGLDVPPEGLEPFFCPCLPASGRGLCAGPPLGQGGSRTGRVKGEGDDNAGGGDGRTGCSGAGAGLSPPPPRLFTFAAPGRSGAGIFYGACLSVFR